MLKIFISYAHEDLKYKQHIRRALHPLVLKEKIKIWEDGELLPGDLYANEITQKLNEADIVIYILSIDFFCSEYCLQKEYEPLVKKWEQGKVKLIPVLATECDYQSTDFTQMQILPTGRKPVNKWNPIEDGLMDVVTGITRIISSINSGPKAS